MQYVVISWCWTRDPLGSKHGGKKAPWWMIRKAVSGQEGMHSRGRTVRVISGGKKGKDDKKEDKKKKLTRKKDNHPKN